MSTKLNRDEIIAIFRSFDQARVTAYARTHRTRQSQDVDHSGTPFINHLDAFLASCRTSLSNLIGRSTVASLERFKAPFQQYMQRYSTLRMRDSHVNRSDNQQRM